jgi:Mg2+ and Co2+ transporter CorA
MESCLKNLRDYIHSEIQGEENFYKNCLQDNAVEFNSLKECQTRIKYRKNFLQTIEEEESEDQFYNYHMYFIIQLNVYFASVKRLATLLSFTEQKLSKIKNSQFLNKNKSKLVIARIDEITKHFKPH